MKKIKSEMSFRFVLLKQFESKWKMLRDAVDKCPEEKWHEGEGDWIYSWSVYHIIETADFYSRNNPESMTWGIKTGINWDIDSKDEIISKKSKITKSFLNNYLEEIELRISRSLSETKDKDLLLKDDFRWFDSVYEKLVYLLRHNSFHIGELAQKLRNWRSERLKWS